MAASDQTIDTISSAATFNLKAVVQETGLKPDTLRAWERRYGVPKPERTSGGHRLYSQDDIRQLKWLVARQGEGLSISRAVTLWKCMLEEGQDPFDELTTGEETPVAQTNHVITGGVTLIDMRDKWIDACMAFQEQSAENILNQALSMYTPETVCFELIQRGLSQIGSMWYEGKVTAQQEHFASGLAMRRVQALVAGTPPPTRSGRILIGCAPQEEHTFSSLLLTLLMRRRGWETLHLGANVPEARLQATIAAVDPQIVILTAQTLVAASNLLSMADLVDQSNVSFAYGGLVFVMQPSIVQSIPGHYLGNHLENAPMMIEQLLQSNTSLGRVKPISASYQRGLEHFLNQQAKLESKVWETLLGAGLQTNYISRANSDLSDNIHAALALGDITLLGATIEWIEGLLTNYHQRLPKNGIQKYLRVYLDAAEESLDERGDIITDWLRHILDNHGN